MPSRRLRCAFVAGLVALLAATGGCASNSQREVQAWRAWNAALVEALVARGDADSLWLAALASRFALPADAAGDDRGFVLDPRSLAWVERAATLAPDDPLVAQMRLVVCRQVGTCDLAAAVADLRRLAPGLPFNRWAVLEVQREVNVTNFVGTALGPPLTPVSVACRAAAERPARVEPCRAIGRLFAASDTALGESFGLSLQMSQWPEDSPEHRALAESRRVLEWRIYAAADLLKPRGPFGANRHRREFVALQAELPREQDVWLALMRRHGVPTEPAPEWTVGDRRVAKHRP